MIAFYLAVLIYGEIAGNAIDYIDDNDKRNFFASVQAILLVLIAFFVGKSLMV